MPVNVHYGAITTKFLGPTDQRGARVKAVCDVGSFTKEWDYSKGSDANHHRAAEMLCEKLGLVGSNYMMVGGTLPKQAGNVYVLQHKAGLLEIAHAIGVSE